MKIAMWSGPRNLSTAMMYAFAARGDCAVWDEPFYAAYLQATGIGHPMAAADQWNLQRAQGQSGRVGHLLGRADPDHGVPPRG